GTIQRRDSTEKSNPASGQASRTGNHLKNAGGHCLESQGGCPCLEHQLPSLALQNEGGRSTAEKGWKKTEGQTYSRVAPRLGGRRTNGTDPTWPSSVVWQIAMGTTHFAPGG